MMNAPLLLLRGQAGRRSLPLLRPGRPCPCSYRVTRAHSAAAAAAAPAPPAPQRSDAAQLLQLLAAVTCGELGLTHEQAAVLLAENVEAAELAEFGADLWADGRQVVVHCDPEVTVLDTHGGPEVHRSLHFSDRLDLVQTAVALDSAGQPRHDRPPPLTGKTGTHLQGLGLALAAHRALQLRAAADCSAGGEAGGGADPGRPLALAVLGAGGGSLPAFLDTAVSPVLACGRGGAGLQITAVELSPAAVAASKEFFGLGTCEARGGLLVETGCAYRWLQAAPPASVDVLIVDLEDGGDERGEGGAERGRLLAPPASLLADGGKLVAAAGAALAPGGVVAFNMIAGPGGAAALSAAADQVAAALPGLDHWICRSPRLDDPEVSSPASNGEEGVGAGLDEPGAEEPGPEEPGHQAVVFCAKAAGGAGTRPGLSRDDMAAALATMPVLVDRPDEWLAGWDPIL
eukprot:SAG22_NODE_334_length_12094_cov_9.446019_9_plen_459_part_00